MNPLQIQQLGKYWVLNLYPNSTNNEPTNLGDHNISGLTTPTSSTDRFILDGSNFQSNILFNQTTEQNGLGIFLSSNVLQNEQGNIVLVDTTKDQQPNDYGLPKISMEQFSQEQLLAGQPNQSTNEAFSTKDQAPQINQTVEPTTCPSSIIKLASSTGSATQETSKPLETMKVNIDDFSQFFSYHEVFGKLPTELLSTSQSNQTVLSSESSEDTGHLANRLTSGIQSNLPVITTNIIQSNKLQDLAADALNAGLQYSCQLCNEVFQFQYQLIVHK